MSERATDKQRVASGAKTLHFVVRLGAHGGAQVELRAATVSNRQNLLLHAVLLLLLLSHLPLRPSFLW